MKRVFIIILLTLSFNLYAQYGTPMAVLEYYDDDLEIEVTLADGVSINDIYYGMNLNEGDTIRTKSSTAEIRLVPNGSIIKLSSFTIFTIENLQKSSEKSNNFFLVSGKLRFVAARAGIGERYQVTTQSAVCGVRGTDFIVISIPGSEEKAFVVSSSIDYTNTLTKQKIQLESGMIGDVFAEIFDGIILKTDQIDTLMEDVIFERLDPMTVPGYEEPKERSTDIKSIDKMKKDLEESRSLSSFGEIFRFEIGTVTIDEDTYSKAIIQPTFNLGGLNFSLYLPMIYQLNLFDTDSWYKPEGNNEWSFGTDQNNIMDITKDVLSDLILKIRYIEKKKQTDSFFLKVGNIDNVTFGHGILLNDFSNNIGFPTIRQIGLNLSFEYKGFGFNTVINDLADPEIFGLRIYNRSNSTLKFGITTAVDIDPDKDSSNISIPNDSIIFTAAGDFSFLLHKDNAFSSNFFADIGALMPYMDGELRGKMLFDTDKVMIKNYILDTGLFGNIHRLNYKFEFRYFNGFFRPTFFNSSYERLRVYYIENLNAYFNTQFNSIFDNTVMAIYGEGSFDFFGIIDTTIGYMLPWDNNGLSDEDEFLFKLAIQKGTIPNVGIYGSISYLKRNFMPTILNKGVYSDMTLFDDSSSYKGEIVYQVSPTLAIATSIGTATHTDEDGKLIYKDGFPEIKPVITIETRLGF